MVFTGFSQQRLGPLDGASSTNRGTREPQNAKNNFACPVAGEDRSTRGVFALA